MANAAPTNQQHQRHWVFWLLILLFKLSILVGLIGCVIAVLSGFMKAVDDHGGWEKAFKSLSVKASSFVTSETKTTVTSVPPDSSSTNLVKAINALIEANNQLARKVEVLEKEVKLVPKRLGSEFVNGIEVIRPDGAVIYYMSDHNDPEQSVGWHWEKKEGE